MVARFLRDSGGRGLYAASLLLMAGVGLSCGQTAHQDDVEFELKMRLAGRSITTGERAAKREIAMGHTSFQTYGLQIAPAFYDFESGLPIKAVAGCVVDQGLVDHVKGHNDYLDRRLKSGWVPPNSLKKWNAVIRDPAAHLDRLESVPLPPGEPVVWHTFTVEIKECKKPEYDPIEMVVVVRNGKRGTFSIPLFKESVGPYRLYRHPDTDLFLIFTSNENRKIRVIDAVEGIALRYADG